MGLSFLCHYAGRWSYEWSEMDVGNDRMVEMFSLHSIYIIMFCLVSL